MAEINKLAMQRIAQAKREEAEELDLRGLGLHQLPEEIRRLKKLRHLRLGRHSRRLFYLITYNFLTDLPDWLRELTQLQSLDLSGNNLTQLPDWLRELTQLQSLDLSGNNLTQLPDWLRELTQLQSLALSGNNLTQLPDWLRELTQLQSLALSGNNLTQLPDWLRELTQLQSLDLSVNKLTQLPDWLRELTQLQSLDLSGNKLTQLPDWLRELTQLQSLDLSVNKLTQLPDWLRELTQLQSLDLRYNNLTQLPDWLRELTQLQSLALRSNNLTQLPDWLRELTQLQSLDLSRNKLTQLPDWLRELTQLQSLDLSGNKLTQLPDWLRELTQLQSLALRSNNLTQLPDWLRELTQLQSLDLSRNNLTQLPDRLRELTQLQSLDLSSNNLTQLPDWLRELTQLQSLALRYNNLTQLPDWLRELTQLQSLALRYNNLTQLPDWLRELTQLQSLALDGNNDLPLPAELLRQTNPQLILDAYFQGRAAAGGRPLHEAKLLLVGQGRVGKTSLLRRLTDGSFDPTEPTTHGINVRSRDIFLPDGDISVRLNMWDFGGQEIMHNTHQFFLTQRSLYLVVLNAREDARANRLHYWLKLIDNIADAPILVVINHIDQNPAFTLDERELRYRYPNIVAFARTNCEEYICDGEEGFDSLEDKIVRAIADRLPHIHDRLPDSYFKIKAELEQMQTPTIQFAAYQAMCGRHGLDDENLQRGYMRVFHELGVVLNYQDDPHLADFGIMNRNWVVQGVYAIITTALLADSRGKLRRSDLPAIFAACNNINAADYPTATHALILDMMQKFELCYPFDTGGSYLVPDLLGKTTPDAIDFDALTAGSLAFRYEFEALPSSIFSRFLVRRHKLILPKLLWHSGVVLRRDGQTAFIRSRADDDQPSIIIDITGPGDRRPLLEIIRSTFEDLFPQKMSVEEMVPLPQRPDLALPYRDLRNMVEDGVELHYVSGIRAHINPGELLGVVEQEGRQSRRLPPLSPRPAPPHAPLTETERLELKNLTAITTACQRRAKRLALAWVIAYVVIYITLAGGLVYGLLWLVDQLGWNTLEPYTWIIAMAFGFASPLLLWLLKEEAWTPPQVYQRIQHRQQARCQADFEFDAVRFTALNARTES